MNFQLARKLLSKRGQSMVSSRFFSSNPLPVTSVVETDGYKVMGLPHLSTTAMKAQYRKKYWLSDPSTYPLLVCLGGACFLCTGFGLYFLTTAPDVRISRIKRSKTIRDWN